MQVSNEVISAHRHLSHCSAAFLEYVKENPEALKRSNYNSSDRFSTDGIVMQPWPVFINKTRRREMEEASVNVFNLIKSIPQRLFNNDPHKISHYYHMPMELVKLQLVHTQKVYLNSLIGRGDFILSPSGLKCLEYNVTASLGGLQVNSWEQAYLGTPVIANFLKKNKITTVNKHLVHILVGHLIDSALEKFGNGDEINSVILYPGYKEEHKKNRLGMYMSMIYKYVFQQKRLNLKGELYISDFNSLESQENHVLLHQKKIHNLLELYQNLSHLGVLNAHQAGNIILYNGPIHFLLGNKLNIALLSAHQDSDIFSPEEKKMIEKYIPWSRCVTDGETTYQDRKINLKDFILANKEKLVLKPAFGYGGFDIHIGRYTPDTHWEKVIESAFKTSNDWENKNRDISVSSMAGKGAKNLKLGENKWIIQEMVESKPYLFQLGAEGCAEHYLTWGFFVFGQTYAGGWVRLLPTTHSRGVINRHQGAEECVLFEVDE